MKTRILITSYSHDRTWLEFNLRSIQKFAHGFDGVTVVVPDRDKEFFEHLCAKYGARLQTRPWYMEKEDDHNAHQVAKLEADKYCPMADFILHTDSDCIFTSTVGPEDYIYPWQGLPRPELVVDEWAHVGAAITWRPGTEHALGRKTQYETMRRHPAVHYKRVYSALRRHIEETHKMPFAEYLMRHHQGRPSEFNWLGNFILTTPTLRDGYHVIDLSTSKEPESSKKLMQFWSLSPPDKPQTNPHSGEQQVPAEIINRILGS